MRSFTAASVLALVGSAAAQTAGFHAINLPGMFEKVPACTTYNIKWTPSAKNQGPVIFKLIGGATQQTLVEIGDSFGPVDGSAGSFAWNVPCDEGNKAVYGLKVLLQADTSIMQYSMPFYITPKDGYDATPTPSPSVSDPVTMSQNVSMTSDPCPTSFVSSMTNMTYTPHPPTTLTSTAYVTDSSAIPASSTTGAPVPTAGASHMVGGSFAAAVLAAAAAFAL